MDSTTTAGGGGRPTGRTHRGRALRGALTATCVSALLAVPAQADPGSRYWSTWTGDGSGWQTPGAGPRTQVLPDGASIGLRYSLVSRDATEGRQPRSLPDFATHCADAVGEPGTKRIAVVVDHGRPEESPTPRDQAAAQVEATCATVPVDFTTEQTLQSVLAIEDSGQGICRVAGHPADGCAGNRVADAEAALLTARDEPVDAQVLSPEQVSDSPDLPEPSTASVAPEGEGQAPSPDPSSDAGSSATASDSSAAAPTESVAPTEGAAETAAAPAETAPLLPWWAVLAALALIGAGLWGLLRPLTPARDGRSGGGWRERLLNRDDRSDDTPGTQ